VTFAERYQNEVMRAVAQVNLEKVHQAIEWFKEAREQQRQIFVFGNGGSAATASHFTCDMVKGASYGRKPRFRIIALTDSLATITAYSNDVAYDAIFVEQLQNFARRGDLAMGISGSGNSSNVLRATEYANSIGCRTLALTGRDGGKLGSLAQLNIHVPQQHMGRIEDVHMVVCHMISYYFMEEERG
jgi:D-sedoheptulose 7-phosphate isomerase